MEKYLSKTAASATLHCLLGCSIGEILGMILTTAFNMHNALSILISVALAFLFGYSLSILPIVRHGISFKRALLLAFASDTLSIAFMEIADNGFILLVPGAIYATLSTALFWWSLLSSLCVAFLVAFPVNGYLLSKGKGHAVVHKYHHESP